MGIHFSRIFDSYSDKCISVGEPRQGRSAVLQMFYILFLIQMHIRLWKWTADVLRIEVQLQFGDILKLGLIV